MSWHFHFAMATGYLAITVVGLLWAMLNGFVAARLEKEGLEFRTGFTLCAVLTPLAGLVAVRVLRSARTPRTLAPSTQRS